uniref:Succinate dehydrogenase subunit 3 n=1 Tax=Tayloriella tenebrosa TaxID=1917049 RepID=UPI0022FD7F47|nr:Succinate dehydrogenase subunit 3 [Tayloriella tenebrosa]WAX04004.1 Succinate dehydrogenase subunit 3 [Tayloriella tenebrosa]
MFRSFYYLLKPFSPHLTIYLNQSSSIFSILHRVSSLTILTLILTLIIVYLYSFNVFFYRFLFINKFLFIILSFLKLFVLKLGIFHIINGLKIIFWNFTYLQNFKNLEFCNKIIGLFFFVFIILI